LPFRSLGEFHPSQTWEKILCPEGKDGKTSLSSVGEGRAKSASLAGFFRRPLTPTARTRVSNQFANPFLADWFSGELLPTKKKSTQRRCEGRREIRLGGHFSWSHGVARWV
jgi:hypothetical protein